LASLGVVLVVQKGRLLRPHQVAVQRLAAAGRRFIQG
jgi:hypothetical protein